MKTLTCIVCPLGCQIRVDAGEVTGFGCIRGKEWARQETECPTRTLTTTVRLVGGGLPLLPVRSQEPVPKARLADCLAAANRLRVQAPVRSGQVIAQDLAGTGARLIATRTVDKNSEY